MGELVSLGMGDHAFEGYMARSNRVGPGVLLLHESFGMIDSLKDFADALNKEGFTVMALDLYNGVSASTFEEAQEMVASLDVDAVRRGLNAAVEHMRESWHPRLGVVGFSLGAGLASALAQDRLIDATVVYYGFSDIDPARWRGPLLGHFAEQDELQPLDPVLASFERLQSGGVDVELYVYPRTRHWFANPAIPDAYAPDAAALAWERTVGFLRHHLS